MRKPPEDIWCENGVYYDYEHDGGIKYVRADHVEAQAAEIERLRGELAKAVRDAFYEGFREGFGGGWIWGDPTPAWKKSDAFAKVKVYERREKVRRIRRS